MIHVLELWKVARINRICRQPCFKTVVPENFWKLGVDAREVGHKERVRVEDLCKLLGHIWSEQITMFLLQNAKRESCDGHFCCVSFTTFSGDCYTIVVNGHVGHLG